MLNGFVKNIFCDVREKLIHKKIKQNGSIIEK